jgi:hypothetical protein
VRNSGKLRLIVVLLSAALLPMLTACLGGDPPPDDTRNNANLLRNAVEGMKALKSYHFSAVTGTPPQQLEMEGDVDVANNRAMLVITDTGRVANVIVVGEDAYVRGAGSEDYSKVGYSDLNLDSVLGMWGRFKTEDVSRTAGALKDATPPKETVEGVSTRHIMGDARELNALTNAGSATEQEGTVEFWLSTEGDPRIHQMKVAGKSDGEDIAGTFKWSRFNEALDIKAP